ncbi:arsenate reductase ArsC [Persephonella sp.]
MKIGFICTGNSARSQMAEGLARKLFSEEGIEVQVYSAGSKPAGFVHPLAVQVMKEAGIDISTYYSKSLEEIPYSQLDIIITLCSEAEKECPPAIGKTVYHWRLKDPVSFNGSVEQQREFFRRIRNQIEEKIRELVKQVKCG